MSTSITDRLDELDALHKTGRLTTDEYRAARAAALGTAMPTADVPMGEVVMGTAVTPPPPPGGVASLAYNHGEVGGPPVAVAPVVPPSSNKPEGGGCRWIGIPGVVFLLIGGILFGVSTQRCNGNDVAQEDPEFFNCDEEEKRVRIAGIVLLSLGGLLFIIGLFLMCCHRSKKRHAAVDSRV